MNSQQKIRNIKKSILKNNIIVGCLVKYIISDTLVRLLSAAGFDVIHLDLEHGFFNITSISELIGVARCSGILPIVRVPKNQSFQIPRLLEAGAEGIVLPLIRNVEEVKEAIKLIKYPPLGERSFIKDSPLTNFGKDKTDYMEQALTIVLIETIEALLIIDELAEIEGIDVFSPGPDDLTESLGISGEYDHPKYEEAILKVKKGVCNYGKVLAINHKNSLIRAKKYIDMGYSFIFHCSDVQMVKQQSQSIEEIRSLRR